MLKENSLKIIQILHYIFSELYNEEQERQEQEDKGIQHWP